MTEAGTSKSGPSISEAPSDIIKVYVRILARRIEHRIELFICGMTISLNTLRLDVKERIAEMKWLPSSVRSKYDHNNSRGILLPSPDLLTR